MFIQTNGLRMFVEERGAENPEAIVFLHGFPFDHSMWRHQLPILETAFHCIVPDLRGHGGTRDIGPVQSPAAVSIDLLAEDVIALINVLHSGDKKITLCGLSMGGYIAFALWRKIPGRIGRLILADTKATADAPEARARRIAQAEKVLAEGPQSISDGMLDSLLTPEHRSSAIGMEVRRMIESTSPQGIANTLLALADRPDSTGTLVTIDVPTLVVVGELDKLTPLSDAQFMHARLPNKAPLTIIAQSGHVSPLENPAGFNRALIGFMK